MELHLYDELIFNTAVNDDTLQIENLNTINIINILSKFLVQYENQANDAILASISNLENVISMLFKLLTYLQLIFDQNLVNEDIILLKLIIDAFKVILRLKLSRNISTFFTNDVSKEMMKKLLSIIVKSNNYTISISSVRCLTNLLFNDPNNVCLFISEDVNGLIDLSLVLNSVKDEIDRSLQCDLFLCITKVFYMIICQCETIMQPHFSSHVDTTIIMSAALIKVFYLCLFSSREELFLLYPPHTTTTSSSSSTNTITTTTTDSTTTTTITTTVAESNAMLIIQIIKLLFALPICDILKAETNEKLFATLSLSGTNIVSMKKQLSQIIYFTITIREMYNSYMIKHHSISKECLNIISLTSDETKNSCEILILQLFMDIPDDVIELIHTIDLSNNIPKVDPGEESASLSYISTSPYNQITSSSSSSLSPSGEDLSKTFLTSALIRVLNRILQETENLKPTEKAAALTPILVVLTKLASIYKDYKDNIKRIVFPNEWLQNSSNSSSIDPKDSPIFTLRGKLCNLMISLDSHLKRTTAEFLFVLCEEDVDEFVNRTGFGNAIALLQIKGLL